MAGLVEYHLIETERGEPAAQQHRVQIRMMLDHLLAFGRTPEGLWRSAVDLDTGKPLEDTLSDNWGYLYSVYLAQAIIEERWPAAGDPKAAEQCRSAAQQLQKQIDAKHKSADNLLLQPPTRRRLAGSRPSSTASPSRSATSARS